MGEITSIDIPVDPGKPVRVDVSTAEDSEDFCKGNLNVSILQSNAILNKSKVEVLKIEENKGLILFKPPEPGLYSMLIKYNDETVSGSPLHLNLSPPDAKQVKLTKPPTGKIGAGHSLEIWFDTTLAGRGELASTCKGEKVGDIPVTVTRTGITNTHKVAFFPPKEDDYSLSVLYSGADVIGSPFRIDLIPINVARVKCSEPYFPKGKSGPLEMDICTEGSRKARLTATCTGLNGDNIHVNIENVSKDNYHLQIDPPNDDTLTLTIKYGGKNVEGSPFVITVTKSEPSSPTEVGPIVSVEDDIYVVDIILNASKPDKVTYGDLHVPDDVSPTNEVWMDVDCSEAGKGTLTAKCTGKNQEIIVPVSVEKTECDSKYKVKFNPPIPEIYTLIVYFGGEIIPGGTFEIDLISESNAEMVHHLDTCMPKEIGKPVVLTFNASKAGRGVMRGWVNGIAQAGLIDSNVNVVDKEKGIYELQFIPDGADTYNVDVFWSNETIPGSPFFVKIIYPQEVILSDPVNPQIFRSIRVDVDTEKAGPGDLTATVSGKNSGTTDIQIIRDSSTPTMYMLFFHPTVSDLYSVKVYFSEEEVKKSPILVDLRVPTDIPKLEVVPIHPISKPYLIKYVNQQDNMKAVLAYAIHNESCTRHVLKIRKRNYGKSLLVFYPQKTGLHFIHIKKGQKEIRGSPFKLDITAANSTACRFIDGPQKFYLNEVISFKVDASKAGSGDLDIVATVPAGGKIPFKHSHDGYGIYTISCIPKLVGRYKVNVKWAGVTIPDSPIIINVLPVPDEVQQDRNAASKVTILKDTDNIFKAKLFHTDGAYFYVKTDLAGKGILTLETEGPANPKIKINKKRNGIYHCRVQPAISGKYDITILWNDVPIPNNPYRLDFTADRAYIVNGLDLESENFILHQPFKFHVNCGKNKGRLTAMATPLESAHVDVNLGKDNNYLVEIIPQLQGNHEIALKFEDKHVLLSPYHVQFESPKILQLSVSSSDSVSDDSGDSMEIAPAPHPVKVRANGPGLLGGIVGQEGNFTIHIGSAEEGELEISVQGPKGTFKTGVRRHPDNDRTLLARYDPTHIGRFIISILWSQKHIEGSPFVVNIQAQKQTTV